MIKSRKGLETPNKSYRLKRLIGSILSYAETRQAYYAVRYPVLSQIYNVEREGYVGAALAATIAAKAAPTVKLSADKTRLTEY
jgi:hypothetical protein